MEYVHVDDDAEKHGAVFPGVPLVGLGDQLTRWIEELHAEEVLLTISKLDESRGEELEDRGARTGVAFRMMQSDFTYRGRIEAFRRTPIDIGAWYRRRRA